MVKGRSLALVPALFSFFSLLACGSDGSGASSGPAPSGTSGKPTTSPTPTGTTPVTSPPETGDALEGLWEVNGTDARGTYTGQVEVRKEGADYKFTRIVRYPGQTVEDARELEWIIRGKLTKSSADVKLEASLKRFDFIWKRGNLTRSKTDGPLSLTASMTLASNQLVGALTATGIKLDDTWRNKKPLPTTPLYTDKRTWVAAHDPWSATEKQTAFTAYSKYHELDVIKPYVSRPEFQAAVHGHWIDETDLDFYRANPNVLRVVDKVVDEISLRETVNKANAYRYTLAKKAELYDKDTEDRFIDPDLGMIPDSGTPGAGYAGQGQSGDSALWTGIYMASQVYRFQVTGNAKAKENAIRSLDALLKLMEITNDWTQFARVLRKSTGNPQPPWHAGTGQFANLEWMEGGNNDMIKGLFIGYLLGYELLCENGKTGYESYCARIRTNAKHLHDDVKLGGSNAVGSQQTNKLPAAWLYAVVTDDIADKIQYQATASSYWAVVKPLLPQTALSPFQGQVDGSGAHLSSVGSTVEVYLAQRMNLSGNAQDEMRASVDRDHGNVQKYRLPEWDLMKAAFGSNKATSAAFVKDAMLRLAEAVYPKISVNIDRTLTESFCMSPFPYQPWKGDFLNYPQSDRTTGLSSMPLFEGPVDILYWKLGNRYRSAEGYEAPPMDYLHLYWFARKFNLITATD